STMDLYALLRRKVTAIVRSKGGKRAVWSKAGSNTVLSGWRSRPGRKPVLQETGQNSSIGGTRLRKEREPSYIHRWIGGASPWIATVRTAPEGPYSAF
ncbi:MAG: hypothetical protein AAF368_15635, partial [Planctomycetota bacterium]